MKIETFVKKLNLEIKSLRWDFQESKTGFELIINNNSIGFSNINSELEVEVRRWFRSSHADGQVYEPGMIATISLLSKLYKRKVMFYDVGALFGYFSFIAANFFNDCKVLIVEANPYSCASINAIKKVKSGQIKVLNGLLSNESSIKRYLIEGYSFFQEKSLNFYIMAFRRLVKYYIKSAFNLIGFQLFNPKILIADIKVLTLPEIFQPDSKNVLEIFKFDTEGFQSVFLPPFINELCSREPIILLEMDSPEKMSNFGVTNNEILQLFIERGYLSIWLDHRTFGEASLISTIDKSQDKNSLCILMPHSKLIR
ncbi:FkbM family methyltransferase [Alphaproteobacteria bacterium]|nr:FkbM family methyltransferase [Alphaproteobacteria bacterium]